MSTATTMSLLEQIEQLFEPAARAARRGDADQIQRVLKALRGMWRKSSKRKARKKSDEEIARGMTFAIEGVLGVVLASSGADARHALLGRKHAVPLLHALGKQARKALSSELGSEIDAAVQMGELARAVRAQPQNIGELIYALRDRGVVDIEEQGPARKVSITEIGVELLEASMPGWQTLDLEQEARDKELQSELRKVEESLRQTLEQTRATEMDVDRLRRIRSSNADLTVPRNHPVPRHTVVFSSQYAPAVEIEQLVKSGVYGKSIRSTSKLRAAERELFSSRHDFDDEGSPHAVKRLDYSHVSGRNVAVTGVVNPTRTSDLLRENVIAAFTLDRSQ